MPKKRVILHIGTHKTGTTTLQRFMQVNAARFAQQGVFVPTTPSVYSQSCPDRTAHFLYFAARYAVKPPRKKRGYLEHIEADSRVVRDAISSHGTVLLSEELLWYDGAADERFWPAVRRCLEELGAQEVSLVVYLRRQDQFICSYWSQYIKNYIRRTKTLEEYLATRRAQCAMDYHAGLKRIEGVFGQGSVQVRLFDRSQFAGGSLVDDFCEAVGVVPDEGFERIGEMLNPSLTPNLTEIKRIANQSRSYRADENFLMGPAVDASLVQSGRPKPSLLSAEQIDELRLRYGPGNALVASEYLGRPGDELFEWPESVGEVWDAAPAELLRDTVLFFTEALAHERAEHRAQLEALEERIRRLESVNRNSLFLKGERKLRGRDTLEGGR